MGISYTAIGCNGAVFPFAELMTTKRVRGCGHGLVELPATEAVKEATYCAFCAAPIWKKVAEDVWEDFEKEAKKRHLIVRVFSDYDVGEKDCWVFVGRVTDTCYDGPPWSLVPTAGKILIKQIEAFLNRFVINPSAVTYGTFVGLDVG